MIVKIINDFILAFIEPILRIIVYILLIQFLISNKTNKTINN